VGRSTAQFADISKLGGSLGDRICDSLIGFHSFTGGCDTVSAFAGRGKLNALQMVSKLTLRAKRLLVDWGSHGI